MRILIIGLGSIGSRHLSILQKIADVEVAALRTSKGTLSEPSGILEFNLLNDALAFQPQGIIIANPTALHIESALPFLEKKIHVLIEKPIGYSEKESLKLAPFSSLIRVAYCMRFHPISEFVKKILQKETLFKLGFKRSYYLPKWHPYANYKKEYTAKKDLGGGVIRTLSHEIDLMLHWLGTPSNVSGVTDKVSDLEIDVDDYAFFSCKYKQGFRVNFDLDFLSPTNIATADLYTNKGKYNWDLTGVWFTPYMENQPILLKSFESNDLNEMYIKQMLDFLGFIQGNISNNSTFEDSIEVLKIIEKIDGK